MDSTRSTPRPSAVVASSPSESSSSTLTVLSAYGVAAAAIPLPFVPSRLLARVRGAVVQEIATRHGLSLTSDARGLLASADADHGPRLARFAGSALRQLLGRIRPLAALTNLSRGIEVYALGVLFERYVGQVRPAGAVRIQADEARRVREALDKAIVRALSPNLRPALKAYGDAPEDLRDEFTRWIDAMLITTAVVPNYVVRRLEAAFDEIVAETPELRRV